MANLSILSEQPDDVPALAALHVSAFHQHRYQAALVALHRRRPDFDPDLSLVARIQGVIVGHLFFAPRKLRLMGEVVQAVNLVSLAVDPVSQGCGVGARLIAEGHARARAKSYTLSFLVGPPAYYSRFGYQPGAFGGSQIRASSMTATPGSVSTRPMQAGDIPAVQQLWRREEAAVDFTMVPGDQLQDWISPNPNIQAHVFVRRGEVVGYTRGHAAHSQRPHVFLAADSAAAAAIAAHIAHDAGSERMQPGVILPLHPASASAAAFSAPQSIAWSSALAMSLGPSPFDTYYREVMAHERAPGRLIWPVEFEAVGDGAESRPGAVRQVGAPNPGRNAILQAPLAHLLPFRRLWSSSRGTRYV